MDRFKSALKSGLAHMGIAIHRVDSSGAAKKASTIPHPIYGEPLEAYYITQGGGQAAFNVPLDKCINRSGFRFGPVGWHPFVETLKHHGAGHTERYVGSLLEAYYSKWKPGNAAEALIFCAGDQDWEMLKQPATAPVLPWQRATPDQWSLKINNYIRNENRENGAPYLTIKGGFNHYGPVSVEKGELEFQRLVRVYRSLKEKGYDRRNGDLKVSILRRGTEYMYLLQHGHHRAAAAVALGYKELPATFGLPPLVTLADVDYWPQVRRGVWPRETAVHYFDHLFEFNSLNWAANHELC